MAARPRARPAKPAKPATKKVAAKRTAAKPVKAATKTGASSGAGLLAVEAQLRDHAMAKPEATEHFPWGERAIKVKGKVFLFMRADARQLSLSTKLPRSGAVALLLPFATPTGYGLGKAGWVSAAFSASDQPPADMLCSWIDESYQAVAPAKLAALARTDGAAAAQRVRQTSPQR
jgi:predicted DNA-binding protein (MmcQ/YjbR family)